MEESKLKIAFVVPYLPPSVRIDSEGEIYDKVRTGGAETWGWSVARALTEVGIEVDVVTYQFVKTSTIQTESDGIRVFHVPAARENNIPYGGNEFIQTLRNLNCDILWFSLFAHRDFIAVAQDASLSRVPRLFSHHGVGIVSSDPQFRSQIARALEGCAWVTFPSPSSFEHYLEYPGIVGRAIILPNGVTFREPLVRPTKATDGSLRLLFVGRLLPHKRVDLAIAAAARLGRDRAVKLCVVGSGPLAEEMGELADRLGVEMAMHSYLEDEELEAMMAESDCLVLPSLNTLLSGERVLEPEAFGLVLVEALSVGTPVAAFDLPGIRFAVGGLKGVALANEHTAESLADAIMSIVDRGQLPDPSEVRRLYDWGELARYAATLLEGLKRTRIGLVLPSTTQLYSGQGEVIREAAMALKADYLIHIVIDDYKIESVRAALQLSRQLGSLITVLPARPFELTLDPQVPLLLPLICHVPWLKVIVIGWANGYILAAVRMAYDDLGHMDIAYMPLYQPTWTVGMSETHERLIHRVNAEILEVAFAVLVTSRLEWTTLIEAYPEASSHAMRETPLGGAQQLQLSERGHGGGVRRLLCVADFNEWRRKGMDSLVAGWRSMPPEARNRLRLTCIGRMPDNPDGIRGVASASQAGIEFKGYVARDELLSEYNQAEFFIMPSRFEAFAIPLVEAMSCGCVPIATATGIAPEIVDAETGFLLDPTASPEDWARVLQTAAGLPVAQVSKMSKSARRAAGGHTWERFRTTLASSLGVSRKPSVAVVHNHYYPENVGGAEAYLRQVMPEVSRQYQAEIVLIEETPREPYMYEGVRVVPTAPADLDFSRYDLVHLNNVGFYAEEVLDGMRNTASRVIVDVHDYWPICPQGEFIFLKTMENCSITFPHPQCQLCSPDEVKLMAGREALLNRADAIVVHSDYMRQRMVQAGTNRDAALSVIPGYIDLEHFSRGEDIGPREAVRIAYVGRISYTKGVDMFFDLLDIMATSELSWEFTIAGDFHPYGDWGVRIIDRARELHIEHRVRLLGKVGYGEVPGVYSRADVVVVPSIWEEPLGLTALESMACGTPVVVFPSGGLVESVRTVGGGVVAKGKSITELCDGIRQALRVRRDASAWRERIAAKWGRGVADQLLLDLYVSVLQDRAEPIVGLQSVE